MRQLGFDVSEEEVTAPAPAACQLLREQGLRPHLLVHEGQSVLGATGCQLGQDLHYLDPTSAGSRYMLTTNLVTLKGMWPPSTFNALRFLNQVLEDS